MDWETATQEIKARLNIVDVIGRYISLERTGRGYKGLCPFHHEKTPSFNVEPEKQFYYCFGCHAKGDIFNFVMHMESLDFNQALAKLAAEAGIVLDGRQEESPHKKLLEIMEQTCQFYRAKLIKSKAEGYFMKRGLKPESIAAFRLGYAPDSWETLQAVLNGTTQELLDCGLIQKRRNNTGYYDRFRNRAIFPIFDSVGRVIAFGARSLGDDKPKYLNSPEGLLFHKKEVLYGWHLAKESARRLKSLILVEGYLDVIACHEAGISNVVASMGTALSEEQIALFEKQIDRVVLAYDADAAGQMANRRGVMMLLKHGFEVVAADFPKGFDPDDVLRKLGLESLKNALATAENYLNRTIRQAATTVNLNEVGEKTKLLRGIAPLINAIPSKALQEEYLQQLVAITNLSYSAVETEVLQKTCKEYERTRTRYNNRVASLEASDVAEEAYNEAEMDFVATIFADPSFINEASKIDFNLDWLDNEGLRSILKGVLIPTDGSLLAINNEYLDLIRDLAERLDKIDELRFKDCLRKLAKRHIYRQIEELSMAVTNSKEPDFYFRALKKFRELTIKARNLSAL